MRTCLLPYDGTSTHHQNDRRSVRRQHQLLGCPYLELLAVFHHRRTFRRIACLKARRLVWARRTVGLDFGDLARCERPLRGNCAALPQNLCVWIVCRRHDLRYSRIRLVCPALRAFGSVLILQMQRTAGSTGRIAAYNLPSERQEWAVRAGQGNAASARITQSEGLHAVI